MRVLLAQLPVPNNPATNTPLAAGYLKAYAQTQRLLDHVQIDILPRAVADHAGDAALVAAIVAHAPDILGFSLYTWNSERSLAIALRVRAQLPDLLVVVGGPECQTDNAWVLEHPAVDIAVIGEGEQTFAAILRESLKFKVQSSKSRFSPLDVDLSPFVVDSLPSTVGLSTLNFTFPAFAAIPGLALHHADGTVTLTPPRAPLENLTGLPSPYLLGYLDDAPASGMLLVEVSRWCPYSCSFCLYGRNMGPKLGGRVFGLEQLLAEIAWGKARGVQSIHFIEANLNLVPLFRPLMTALADLNADGALALYAELRGEHLGEPQVAALAQAGLRVAEVGLQTANPAALRAAQRRTDLPKWAAGTRRLYAHGVEVLLDVILGLPEDDAAGVQQTLEFIQAEQLGPYDVFTLQLLPGTAVRTQAAARGYRYQDRPPYYVLQSDRLAYSELRALRATLKRGAGLDPDEVEGCPPPDPANPAALTAYVNQLDALPREHVGRQLSLTGSWPELLAASAWLSATSAANPSTLIDLFLTGVLPEPAVLSAWRATLPHTPGYLDRVAAYRSPDPDAGFVRVSPRLLLLQPWESQLDPAHYAGVADVIWHYTLAPGEEPPLRAWAAAGGAGVLVSGAAPEQAAAWAVTGGLRLWITGRSTPPGGAL